MWPFTHPESNIVNVPSTRENTERHRQQPVRYKLKVPSLVLIFVCYVTNYKKSTYRPVFESINTCDEHEYVSVQGTLQYRIRYCVLLFPSFPIRQSRRQSMLALGTDHPNPTMEEPQPDTHHSPRSPPTYHLTP